MCNRRHRSVRRFHRGFRKTPALAAAEKVLWVREPKTCVAAEVPVAGGKGTILFSQLDVQRRAHRSEPHYDPVSEKVLINMFEETQRKEK